MSWLDALRLAYIVEATAGALCMFALIVFVPGWPRGHLGRCRIVVARFLGPRPALIAFLALWGVECVLWLGWAVGLTPHFWHMPAMVVFSALCIDDWLAGRPPRWRRLLRRGSEKGRAVLARMRARLRPQGGAAPLPA